MAIPDRLEQEKAIEAAKDEILAALTEQGNVIAGCVKSVQRGEMYFNRGSGDPSYYYINISPVNLEKSVLILKYEGNSLPSNLGYSFELKSNQIKFSTSLIMAFRFLWQVVEFY